MPRYEINAPTERILRILDDINEMEAWMEAAVEKLTAEQIATMPEFPRMIAIVQERTRQQITYRTTRANRIAQQRSRERFSRGHRVRSRSEYTHDREAEISSAIDEIVTKDAVGQTITDLSEDIQPTETHVIESHSSGEIEDPLAGGLRKEFKADLARRIAKGEL